MCVGWLSIENCRMFPLTLISGVWDFIGFTLVCRRSHIFFNLWMRVFEMTLRQNCMKMGPKVDSLTRNTIVFIAKASATMKYEDNREFACMWIPREQTMLKCKSALARYGNIKARRKTVRNWKIIEIYVRLPISFSRKLKKMEVIWGVQECLKITIICRPARAF